MPEAKLKVLEKALANNALTAGDFKPGEGFNFFHSVGDEVVPTATMRVYATPGEALISRVSPISQTRHST